MLLTEDSSEQAFATLKAVSFELLRLVDPQCRPQKLGIEPVAKEHQPVVRANMWRSTNARHQRQNTDFIRYMATMLSQDTSFVFFHVDGDAQWANRDESKTVEQFENLVVGKIKKLLGAKATTERLGRLFRITPFYSIEAWLFQNTSVAIAICARNYQHRDIKLFEAWSNNRHELDEIEKIKTQTCLASKHNLELAEMGFPASIVHGVGKSFAEVVGLLKSSELLVSTLAKTRHPVP